jgi:transcriptional regulator with XRE-family HTH domain
MTKVQFIKVTGGEELAILPKRDYQRLAALAAGEDAGVARIVRRARAALTSGREIVLPKSIVDRLAASENPIRVLREWREMTQVELAAAIGITQGYLSDLEAGKRTGPVALHHKVARSLGVPIDLLLPAGVSNHDRAPVAERLVLSRPRKRQRKERVERARRRR